MIKITYFYREKRTGVFSIEELFSSISNSLNPSQFIVSRFFFDPTVSRFKNLARLINTFRVKKYEGDVNHITGDIHFIAMGLSPSKTVLTVHDLGSFEKPDHRLKKAIYRLFWLTLPLNRVQYITTVSEFTKAKVLHYFKIPAEKVRVIYNPLDPLFVKTEKEFNESNPCILAIGTGEHKNFHRLIEAVKGLSCKLCIIGRLDEALLSLLKQYEVSYENYYNIRREEVIDKYKSCDLLFFASLYEGFGMPIIEANAIGRPVITSNRASMPEVASDAALIVNPESVSEIRSSIQKIIEQKDIREDLIRKGYRNASRFNHHVIVKQYESLYTEVIASSNTK